MTIKWCQIMFLHTLAQLQVNINTELEDIGLIVIGGVNKHFNFDNDYLIFKSIL